MNDPISLKGVSVSRPVSVSQAGFGGIAISGGQSFASAGIGLDEKNQVSYFSFKNQIHLLSYAIYSLKEKANHYLIKTI